MATTPIENISIGQRLARWRTARHWTLGQLALHSGISVGTLSRWEAGLVQPQIRGLEAVLDALEVSEVQRIAAYRSIHAIRASKCIASYARKYYQHNVTDGHPLYSLPRTGDLLRAIRIRQGITQVEVAAFLNIHQSSIARWESSIESPRREHLQALFSLLEVTTEEAEILARGPFFEPSPYGTPSLEDAMQKNILLGQKAVLGAWHTADVTFFQLETDLWQGAQQSSEHMDLLIKVYGNHARYLAWRGRRLEAKRYIEILNRVGADALLSRDGLSPPVQTGRLLQEESVIHSGDKQAIRSALIRLQEQEERFTHLEHRAWMYMIIANGLAALGESGKALQYCARCIAIPMLTADNRTDDPPTILSRAMVLHRIRRPAHALADVERLSDKQMTPAQLTSREIIRALSLVSLRDPNAASEAVQTGYTLSRKFGLLGCREQLDRIASKL